MIFQAGRPSGSQDRPEIDWSGNAAAGFRGRAGREVRKGVVLRNGPFFCRAMLHPQYHDQQMAMIPDPGERERRLLETLVSEVDRLLDRPFENGQQGSLIDTSAMDAGESSILALKEYDLVNLCLPTLRFGEWTDAGKRFRQALPKRSVEERCRHNLPVLIEVDDREYTPATGLGIGKREALLLEALCSMAQQYYVCEQAITVLAEYGLVEPTGCSGQWTEAGRKFQGWCLRELQAQAELALSGKSTTP